MNYGCNGRRAVISGGTSGIGFAAARTLLADGAEVWLWRARNGRSFWQNLKKATEKKYIL